MWTNYQQMNYNGLQSLISTDGSQINNQMIKPVEENGNFNNNNNNANLAINSNTMALKYEINELQNGNPLKAVVENPSSI